MGKPVAFEASAEERDHARIHLDDDQPPVAWINRELDVRSAGFHTDLAQASDAGIAHHLIFLVGQGQRRRHGDAVAGMDAHRIDILDRTNDDGIVVPIADDLHLILLPAQERFLDQHLIGWACIEAARDDLDELVAIIGDPAASSAHCEAGTDDCGKPRDLKHPERIIKRMGNPRAGRFEPDPVHCGAKLLPVLSLVDRLGPCADHFHAEALKRAIPEQRQRGIERGLPPHRRQNGIGPFRLNDPRNHFRGNRLDIGRVGQFRIGHDRGRVRVHEHDAIALFLEGLYRLRSRIVELARLADDDRSRADDKDRGDVSAFWHQLSIPANFSNR